MNFENLDPIKWNKRKGEKEELVLKDNDKAKTNC